MERCYSIPSPISSIMPGMLYRYDGNSHLETSITYYTLQKRKQAQRG